MFDDDPQRAEDARRLYLGAVRHAEALHVVGRVASEFYGAEATEVRDVDDKPEITIQLDGWWCLFHPFRLRYFKRPVAMVAQSVGATVVYRTNW